jgi:nucleotide-binding universal stress UspA family protein
MIIYYLRMRINMWGNTHGGTNVTTVVPFDDTNLARAALVRATEVSDASEEVVALTVIPTDDREYARERGWLGPDEAFDTETIVTRLSETVEQLAPGATFEYTCVGRYAPPGQIANEVRTYAHERGARMIVIGSDSAGRIASTLGSIGRVVAANGQYDTLIVRSQSTTEREIPPASP